MAQHSRPQAGIRPADGDDCGAYTADQWRAVLIGQNRSGGMIVTGAAAPPGLPATQVYANRGVHYATADRLAVTSPGASQISIATGTALVDGTMFANDDAITATAITNPAANPRIDRVVVRQNYTAVDYTSVNAPALVVDLNTSRICIISGAEAVGPVAPTLTQDEDRATYWDIPLYQYEISIAGVITGLTDEREWVDAETRYIWCDASRSKNTVTGAISLGFDNYGWEMTDGGATDICVCGGNFVVPGDYATSMVISPVFSATASGNIQLSSSIIWAECGETRSTHSVGATAAYAITLNIHNCIIDHSLSPVVPGDIVNCLITRDATNVNDTLNASCWFHGWIIEYVGYGRR